MKKILFILLSAMVVLSSCVSQRTTTNQYSPFTPDEKRLYLTMNDYEYLGDIQLEVSYKTYFGSIHKILTVNGEAYNPRFYRLTNISWDKKVKMSKVMRRALYKVTDTYPTADFIIPASQNVVHNNMFGGKEISETMTVKVFRLRQRTQADIEAEHQRELEQERKATESQRLENEEMQRQISTLRRQLQEAQDALQQQQQQQQNRNRRR